MRSAGRFWSSVGLTGLLAVLVGCHGLEAGPAPNPPPPTNSLQSVNHIIVMAQENRSFDHYFGKLAAYRAANGFPTATIDGLPGDASNPSFDGLSSVPAYHLGTVCIEDLSPSWNESHVDWNRNSPTSDTATMDGYVYNAARYAQNPPPGEGPLFDLDGLRSMGYYDERDLNYYYFMASSFATSDSWFSPVMSRTQPNRLYLISASSTGHVYPLTEAVTNKTIFEALDNAGITWKVYETDPGSSYLYAFQPYAANHVANIVPVAQYLTDVQNGTLPSVALIEGGYDSGRDEHPNGNVQTGAAYVSSLINPLLTSSSWKDSIFILTYDEAGGLYDHVAPIAAVSPDDIPPSDLAPTDICHQGANQGSNCDFNHTGYRVPMIVVSPFTKKNYVSHVGTDYTAVLRLIEKRFSLDPLTKRDADASDMQDFFDFPNGPWAVPPSNIPVQSTGGVCDYQALQ